MNKPLIGVSPLWDDKLNSLWMLPEYLEGIENAGGIPIILPLTMNKDSIERFVNLIDGFLFTGGQDVSPILYGEKTLKECGPTSTTRDRMEQMVFEKMVINLNKPVLGICRGIQLINVLLGGSLYQDLPTQINYPLSISSL